MRGTEGPAAPPTESVLLVEDDDGDAFLVGELLAGFGGEFSLRRARSLSEAAEAMEEDPGEIACVLLDLGLPDSGGLDGLAAILTIVPEAAVIVLTGLADRSQGAAAVALGAQDYLVKGSIDGEGLARSLRYSLARRRGMEAARRLNEAELLGAENARLERGLLPRPLIEDPAIHWRTRYRPGGRRALLGGDFFDAVELPDGTIRIVVGDVAGHGPDEAALGVALRVAWRALVLAGLDAGAALPVLQRMLERERGDPITFATVCDFSLCPDRRAAQFRIAGHPVPLRCGASGVRELPVRPGGLPLGAFEDARWQAQDVDLGTRWTILTFTDGITDGRDGTTGQRLGSEGLARLAERACAGTGDLGAVADRMLAGAEEANGGPLPDDVALFLVSADSRWAP